MVNKPTSKQKSSSTTYIILILLMIFIVLLIFQQNTFDAYYYTHDNPNSSHQLHLQTHFSKPLLHLPKWYQFIAKQDFIHHPKIGLVNIHDHDDTFQLKELQHIATTVHVDFRSVTKDITWKQLFPEWVDENENKCPEIPMPVYENYPSLNIVAASVPCPGEAVKRDFEDVYRLQINLVIANLLVRNGDDRDDDEVYVVFFGPCRPMIEFFRCEDLLWNEENVYVYKPDLRRLKQKVLMPVGSCQIASSVVHPGQEDWKQYGMMNDMKDDETSREAFVTVLHSSEKYVCGAIALAQSIIQSKSTKDLILLADHTVSPESAQVLELAGWKIKKIKRIRSPNAKKDAYNEWNYSKLRIWQLTQYDKLIFLDSDLLLLQNIDHLYAFPQLSAAGNSRHIFNSGVMLVEPSKCTFDTLMKKRSSVVSYNGGDQGFLNEIFRWWHRWPTKVNFLKDFYNLKVGPKHEYPENTYALHYLGMKPWMCYEDYDCNWDIKENQRFASDSANARWWKVYKSMPEKLQSFCGLTPKMEKILKTNREIAKKANFSDGHWKIVVKDPRRSRVSSDTRF